MAAAAAVYDTSDCFISAARCGNFIIIGAYLSLDDWFDQSMIFIKRELFLFEMES